MVHVLQLALLTLGIGVFIDTGRAGSAYLVAYYALVFYGFSLFNVLFERDLVLTDQALHLNGTTTRATIPYTEITLVHQRDRAEGEQWRQRLFSFMRGSHLSRRVVPCVHFAEPRFYLTLFWLPPLPWLWRTRRFYITGLDSDAGSRFVEELSRRVEAAQPDLSRRSLPTSHLR
jgi:hypothetical protein